MVANQPLKKTQMTIYMISSKNQLILGCEHNMNHNDLWLDCLVLLIMTPPLNIWMLNANNFVDFKYCDIKFKSFIAHTWGYPIAHGDIYKLYGGCHNINFWSSAWVRWHFEDLFNGLSKSNNRTIIKVLWGQFLMFRHCHVNESSAQGL